MKAQSQADGHDNLSRAELQDVRRHLEVLDSLVASLRSDMRRCSNLATTSDLKTRELEHALERDLDRIITENSRQELHVHLHKMEPLLIRMQQFLDKVLSTMMHSRVKGEGTTKVRINKMTSNSFTLFRNTSKTVEVKEVYMEELMELASAIQATKAKQSSAIKDLQARAEDHVVLIDGERFPSLTFVAAYEKTNNMAPHVLKFVDAMLLMETITAMAQSFSDNVDTQCRGSRSQIDCPSDQKAIYLFQLTAPTALAGPPDTARSHPRLLLAFRNYDAFKGTGSGNSGAVNELIRMLDEKTPAFATEITSSDMSQEAQFLAKSLIDSSKRFLVTLLTFMENQMKEYGAETNLSEARRRELVQAIVRIVFGVISKARRLCSEITILEANSATRSPDLVWAVLQAHHVQTEFLAHHFKSHPADAPLLTHFLLDVVAFHNDVKPLVKDVSTALSESHQVKRKLDSPENQKKNLQSKLPAKKNKAGGKAGGDESKE